MNHQHCTDPEKCGRPIKGHPKAGWIKARVAGQDGADRWWCSLACLVRDLSAATAQGRPDVALCVACIDRHDRDHRCPVCGTQPHVVRGVPTPARRPGLYRDLGRPA